MEISPITRALKLAIRWSAFMVLAVAMLPASLVSHLLTNSPSQAANSSSHPNYRDVQPILQKHCVVCHIEGGVAPMAFDSYENARRYAFLIRNATQDKAMPPAFAVPLVGDVTNNPALTSEQLATLLAWANAKAPPGSPPHAIMEPESSPTWSIPKPELVVPTASAVEIPATGSPAYVYEIVPTNFHANCWVQMAEVIPSSRTNVLQIVVFVRRPGSPWLRSAPLTKPFPTPGNQRDSRWANDDILAVFAPGSPATRLPSGTAKLIPAGADLVFRIHYAPSGVGSSLQSSVGLIFSKQKPLFRVATLALEDSQLKIPPEVADYQADARGVLTRDVTLLNLFPVMHLRGKQFEFDVLGRKVPNGPPLLRVTYDRRWQPVYPLSKALPLPAGTRLRALATYDNSSNNPANPDAHASVHWGDRTEDEVLQVFFDVAIPSKWKKDALLVPH